MDLSTPLAWNEDVLLLPVTDLPDELRSQIDCDPGDFALSRPQARTGSKILDPDSADLVGRFRQPRTVVEAVILYGRTRGVDPEEVLEEAFPLIRGLVQGGFLVASAGGGHEAPTYRGLAARWSPGEELLGGSVARVLQVLEDTEVYLLERPGGAWSVIKLERRPTAGAGPGGVAARLRREAAYLAYLDGRPSPRLLAAGEIDGLAYLELEQVAGLDALRAAAEWRGRDDAEGRRRLLHLLRAVADAYAALHARGVLHGDVHPENVLITGDAGGGEVVRLIDFGVASAPPGAAHGLAPAGERAGVPFFFEPELARAYLAGRPGTPATAAGEQFAVATLLFVLATGANPRDWSLGREAMLSEIAEIPPLPFRQRGAADWPGLESVLGRALAKAPEERFPSLAALAAALAEVEAPTDELTAKALAAPPAKALAAPPAKAPVKRSATAVDRLVGRVVEATSLDGPWLSGERFPAPTASINYGAAGIGLGLLQIALARGDAELLSLADLWARRAGREVGSEAGFYNPEIDISRQIVGESSPYHTPSGVHAVAALVARAAGDPLSQAEAIGRFLAAVERPGAGLDLTLGRGAVLLGTAILADALPPGALAESPLGVLGDRELAALWSALDAKPPIREADVDYLGIAHGWAGFLYATLQWCRVAGRPVPAGVAPRLAELAELAVPVGRGRQWAWTLAGGRAATMPGWCNGACGYVFLWTLADSMLGAPRALDLAVGAALESYDSPERAGSLCCGLAGRGYALLNLYRHTGDRLWLDRARELVRRAASAGAMQPEYPHSLWKGEVGLAVLAADLERPEHAAMPFFEPLGYSRPAA